MKAILLFSCLVAVGASPLVLGGSTSSYSFSYEAPQQSRHEWRGPLGDVRGMYSVRYPHGGLLTQTYHYPAPVVRLLSDGPLGPAGAIVPFRKELLNVRPLDTRAPTVLTRADGLLVDSAPFFVNSKVSPFLLHLRLQSEPASALRQQQLQLSPAGDALILEAADLRQTPGDTVFVNSKESPVLVALRLQSEQQDGLVGRDPPIEGHDSFVVEARGVADEEVPL